MSNSSPILVTGVAGFIGFHLVRRLLRDGHKVVGIDSLTSYYNTQLKQDRLAQIAHPAFTFNHLDLTDHDAIMTLFATIKPKAVIHLAAQATSAAPWRVLNIGNNNPTQLEHFITILEDAIGIKAIKEYLPMQDGDVRRTAANIDAIHQLTGFTPQTSIETGIPAFVDWYRQWNGNR